MLILLLACTPDLVDDPLSVSVEASPTGTAFTARWRSQHPGDASVEVGVDEAYGQTFTGTSSEDGLDHAVVVAGLPSGEAWHWRAVTTGDEVEVSEDQAFVPPPPPADLPNLTVTGERQGLVVAPVISGGGSYAAIYDGSGRPVWWSFVSSGFSAVAQARVSLDGRAVLYMAPDHDNGEETTIVRTSIATGDSLRIPFPGGHHDFLEIDDGVYVGLQSDARTVDGVKIGGDALVELSEAGTRTLWSTWDDLEVGDLSGLPELMEGTIDWTHLNTLAWDGSVWWLSSYNRHSLLLVDPELGLVGEIGGADSDYRLVGGEGFGPQHSPYPTRKGFLLFDNGGAQDGDAVSEAAAYELDEVGKTYERVWEYRAESAVYTPIFGGAEPTPDGDVLVSWGAAGMLSVVTQEGEETWRAEAPLGFGVGFAHVARLAGAP